eukprot:TRINITY_DN22483_c0_g1_i1.p1 TRINITY_DN22483_c0_g1~~TRINITY_DN22483_c0_g1_i1.p1  ORF type:complete len:996 (+),score=215.53 TRINITY_DN22483_c0_g1_i1:66-2990(+)
MTQISEAVLLQSLADVTSSPDAAKRAAGEKVLVECLTVPGFGVELVKALLDESLPFATRQLAAVVLKKLVKERWDEGISEQEKTSIRTSLPAAFNLSNSKLTTMAGVVVGEIATHDYPEEWPTLLTDLVGVLGSCQAPPVVAATVKCLRLIAEDIPSDSAENFCETALPGLCQVIETTTVAPNVRRNALAAVDSLLQTATEVSLKAADMPVKLRSSIPPLCALCIPMISDRSQPLLASAALSFFNLLISCFPSVVESMLPTLISLTCNSLSQLVGSESVEDGYTSDGDTFNKDTLISGHLELIRNFLKKKKSRQAMEKSLQLNDDAKIKDLMKLLIRCSWLTEDEVEDYLADPGSYVQNEEQFEEGYSWTSREVCCGIFEELHELYKQKSVKNLLETCQALLTITPTTDWREAEAGLVILSTCFLNTKRLEKCGFTSAQVFNVCNAILSTPVAASSPLLSARVFWLMNKTIRSLKVDSVPPQTLQFVVSCVSNEAMSHVAKTQASRSFITVHKKTVNGSAAAPAVVDAVRKMLASKDPALKGDTLNSYIEDLAIIIDVNKKVVDVSSLPRDAILLWHKYHTDPFTVEAVTDLFSILTSCPSSEPSMREVVPYLTNQLSNPDALPPGMVSSGVLILSHITKKASENLLHFVATTALPLLEFLTVKQHATSSIALCLRYLVTRVGGENLQKIAIQSVVKGTQETALVTSLNIIQHTLSPENSEHSLSQSGKLILQVIGAASSQIGVDGLSGLLGMVVQRLTSATTSMIAQELLLPLCAMSIQNGASFSSFLRTSGPQNGLQIVLQIWVNWIPDFWGSKHELQLLLAGLTSLAQHVGDDFTLEFTESKKKGKTVALPATLGVFVAICKLLLSVVDQRDESKDIFGFGDCSTDEEEEEFIEEEDEDEEAEEEEGEGSDYSDSEEEFVLSKETVLSLCGDSVVDNVKSYLKSRMATLGQPALPYFTEKERQALQKHLGA